MDQSKNERLLKSVLQGRDDFNRRCAEYSPLSTAGLHHENERYFYSSGMDYAPCNGVIEKIENKLSEKEIDLAIHYFRGKKIPFVWWSDDKLLEKKGFTFGGILKGIATHLAKIPHFESPKDVIIKKVESHDLKAFTDICIEVFGMKQTLHSPFLSILHLFEKEGEAIHFMAYVENKPVGTLTLITSQLSAGIWNGATLESYRRKGVMSALVHEALHEAKKRQYEEVMAILMPKGLAAGLCKNLSFQDVCDFPFYIYGANGPLEK